MNDVPTAVIFIRVPMRTGNDAKSRLDEARALDRQRTIGEAAADKLGAQVIRFYIEDGGTGSIDNRPTVRLMLDEMRVLRDTNYLIVESADRLTRRHQDWAALTLEVEANGAGIVIAEQEVPLREEVAL